MPKPQEPSNHPDEGQKPPKLLRRGGDTSIRSSLVGIAVLALLSVGGIASIVGGDTAGLLELFRSPIVTSDDIVELAPASNDLVLRNADIHPSKVYERYLSNQSRTPDARSAKIARDFQELISLYETRQGVDDNFTLRIIDNRTGGLIQVVSLDSARAEFNRGGESDWNQIDIQRRARTSQIVRELAKTIDRQFITVKWGRRNEILEARSRESATVEHEVRLARALGLSLLTTEIGTVETFNNDALVSRVGARSRYQLMPSILRELGINHYSLKSATGKTIRVQEEMHPLISMEASYTVVRAYSNAMGHEIPGISAYHAGPFNVFRLYERYLDPDNDLFDAYSTVVTAYLWGLTEGFDQVTENTSFGTHSRNYVPSVFGALEATADVPIDTSQSWIVERVRLNTNTTLFLSDLLESADRVLLPKDWRALPEDTTTYLRFKRINPHIDLPEVTGNIIPERADVKLVSRSGRKPVHFFLPFGTAQKLRLIDLDYFDPSETKTWTHGSYYDESEKTIVDKRYDELVASAVDFGFTREAVDELEKLYFEMQRLKKESPSWYRQTQYNIIRLHRRVWRAGNYERITRAAEAARSRVAGSALARLPELEALGAQPMTQIPSSRKP